MICTTEIPRVIPCFSSLAKNAELAYKKPLFKCEIQTSFLRNEVSINTVFPVSIYTRADSAQPLGFPTITPKP